MSTIYSGAAGRRIMLPKLYQLTGAGAKMIKIRLRHELPQTVLGHLRAQKIVTGSELNPFKLNDYLSNLQNRLALSEIKGSEAKPDWLRDNDPTALNLANAIIGRLTPHTSKYFAIYSPGIDPKAAFLAMGDISPTPTEKTKEPEDKSLPNAHKTGRPKGSKNRKPGQDAAEDKIIPEQHLLVSPERYSDLMDQMQKAKAPEEKDKVFWRFVRRIKYELQTNAISPGELSFLIEKLIELHKHIDFQKDKFRWDRQNCIEFLETNLQK